MMLTPRRFARLVSSGRWCLALASASNAELSGETASSSCVIPRSSTAFLSCRLHEVSHDPDSQMPRKFGFFWKMVSGLCFSIERRTFERSGLIIVHQSTEFDSKVLVASFVKVSHDPEPQTLRKIVFFWGMVFGLCSREAASSSCVISRSSTAKPQLQAS